MFDKDRDIATEQFHELYTKHRQKLICFANSYLRDRMAAEDIVMDSFMSFWEHRHAIREGESPLPYVMVSVRNKCLNYLKSQQVRKRAKDEISSLSFRVLQIQISSLSACDPEKLFEKETRSIISGAIDQLPEQTREIFLRSRFEGQSYKQIMDEMKISFRTVDYELRKANRLLGEKLKYYFPHLMLL